MLCVLHLLYSVGDCVSFLPLTRRTVPVRPLRSDHSCRHGNSVHRIAHSLHSCCNPDQITDSGDMPQHTDWLVVGISGVTCGGKTTLASALHAAFPGAVLLHQDTYFLAPDDARHTVVPSLNHVNWEIPSALDMERMRSDVQEIITRPITNDTTPLLIVEGFLIFVDEMISSLCKHKFFFTLTRDECWSRRRVRTYDPPDPPGYFDQVVWPEYAKHIQLALDLNPDVGLLTGHSDMDTVLCKVQTLICQDLDKRKK